MNAKTIIKSLIQIQSYSGDEIKMLKLIKKLLKSINFDLIEIPGAGLVVKIPGTNKDRAIIFNCHVDTVHEGEISNWSYPPFGPKSGIVLGKKIFGLGASDMKASIASVLLLSQKFRKEKPKCDIWLAFVVKEETDGSGTTNFLKWFKKNGYPKKYQKISAIVCEPTGLSEIDLGHRGNVFIKLSIKGDSGHGSRPEEIKKNTTLELSRVVSEIESKKAIFLKEFNHPIMGNPTIGTTSIQAGNINMPNKFPGMGSVGLDFRFNAGFTEKPENIIKKILPDIEYQYEELTKFEPNNAPFVNQRETIIQALSKASGIKKFGIKMSSSDMATFVKNGIPACIFGPGDSSVIHKPNEYCDLDKVEKAADIFYKTIQLYSK